MSTRRARIKAITSLPPRRKNVDNSDNKTKQNILKDDSQKVEKSPKTPRKNDLEKATKSPLEFVPLQDPHYDNIKANSQAKTTGTPKAIIQRTPKIAEKNPVITSAATASVSIKSVFASPRPRTDSPVRNTASPFVPSPKFSQRLNNIQKAFAPLRGKLEGSIIEETVSVKDSQEKHLSVSNENKSCVPDDYNVPSVPESITDEPVMDGIVPLQPTRSAPKPLDFLKNEIISENAEVLFDPIVPLPSPSKVRPKLRPIPRLAPLRRNSIQGSASESEDESRRALLGSGANTPAPARQRHDSHTSHSTLPSLTHREVNRVRNDSVCSSISQATIQPPPATSPTKEKHFNKARRQEMSRRMVAMRRRRETVKRDALTMYDLIFYNPTSNPIVPDQEEIKAKEADKKDAEVQKQQEEEEADDPPPGNQAPVPQIKLGPNGEIILDETSLVIKQTDSKRKVSSVVREGAWGGGGGKYTRSNRTAEWSAAETVRFYRALAAIGTDFSLMAPLFPDRTRRDIKIKFKKEEKINGAQVDKALRSATTWDAVRLQEEFEEERKLAAKKAEMERERLLQEKKAELKRVAAAKELHVRRSQGSKALETSVYPAVKPRKNTEFTANELIQRSLEDKAARARKRKEDALARKQAKLDKQEVPTTPYATLTLVNKDATTPSPSIIIEPRKLPTPTPNIATSKDMATLSRVELVKTPSPAPINLNAISSVAPNIESGSLVVLTVNDPNSPSKKMLQTYIAHGAGKLTPVALPPTFLNSVVGYMKKGTPKSNSTGSPQLLSPLSVGQERTSTTPGVIQVNPSPSKRQRHSSYTITQL